MTLYGNKIREFLQRKNQTREWLAVQLNCSRETIDRLLAGKAVGVEKLRDVAVLMGCRVDDLIPPKAGTALKRPA